MAVVQLARTSDCGSEGYGFDSRQSPHAEWCNGSMTDSDSVGIGSNPISVGFLRYGVMVAHKTLTLVVWVRIPLS